MFQLTLTLLKSLQLLLAPPLNFIPSYGLLFQYLEINDFWNKVYTHESINSIHTLLQCQNGMNIILSWYEIYTCFYSVYIYYIYITYILYIYIYIYICDWI